MNVMGSGNQEAVDGAAQADRQEVEDAGIGFDVPRGDLDTIQRALFNILDDAAVERLRLEDMQRAILNILDDDTEEKSREADAQRAVLNILDDFDLERQKVE